MRFEHATSGQQHPAGRRRWLAAALLPLAVLGTPAGSVRPAAAVPVPPVIRVAAGSATDSNPVKSATASCPEAHPKLIGTGAEVVNGNGQVILDDITPNAFLNQVLVRVREDSDGFGGNWSVRAHAICTNLNVSLTRVSSTSAANTTGSKSATATCPANRNLVGTGGAINSGFGQVAFDDIFPHADLKSVTVWATEIGGNPTWSVTSYAICSDINSLLLSRVFHTNSNDIPIKSATATCPLNYTLLGTGAELVNSGGNAIVDDITPNGSAAVAPNAVTVWAIERTDGAPWSVRAWAICIAPPEQ